MTSFINMSLIIINYLLNQSKLKAEFRFITNNLNRVKVLSIKGESYKYI